MINAVTEIAWLCDRLPEDRLKKISSDEIVEAIFKIQERVRAVSGYPLTEGYDVKMNITRSGILKGERIELFREYDEKKLERLLMHIDTEIDAITYEQAERRLLKKAIRDAHGFLHQISVLRTRELQQLKSDYANKLITVEEYAERRELLDSELRELTEP